MAPPADGSSDLPGGNPTLSKSSGLPYILQDMIKKNLLSGRVRGWVEANIFKNAMQISLLVH
jgi:hypothetical protein